LDFCGFLSFFKKPKKPRFFKSEFYSPAINANAVIFGHENEAVLLI